jgi:hypothetical protein
VDHGRAAGPVEHDQFDEVGSLAGPEDQVPSGVLGDGFDDGGVDSVAIRRSENLHESIVLRNPVSWHGGRGCRLPIASPLKPILLRAHELHWRPDRGRVLGRLSVTSGRLVPRVTDAWADAVAAARGRGEKLVLDPIGLHECRHTYASFLMAAGYTPPRAHGVHGPQLAPGHRALREAATGTRRCRRPTQRLPSCRSASNSCILRPIRGMPEEGLEPPTRGL